MDDSRAALQLLEFHLGGWWGAAFELQIVQRDGRIDKGWHQAGQRRGLQERLQLLDLELGAEVRMSPGRQRVGWESAKGSCLWVRVQGTEQKQRLRQLRPSPAVVLEESACEVAFWPLNRFLDAGRIARANRRIAYRVGAVQKPADPDRFWFTLPGSVIRLGPKGEVRKRPGVCRVVRCVEDVFTVSQVVRQLKDPPPPRDWRQERGEA